ncbi:hypothetical protein Q3G72_009195 [Acer saccharum]|nr:hypothetical protein Q3G72_009195 [Acer saccharum]
MGNLGEAVKSCSLGLQACLKNSRILENIWLLILQLVLLSKKLGGLLLKVLLSLTQMQLSPNRGDVGISECQSISRCGNGVAYNLASLAVSSMRMYVLETSVYPREPEPLKELRDVTAGHPMSVMGTAPDAGGTCGERTEDNGSMVEKLSTTAPDGQTKIKFLSAIAEEHNITWDPDSFSGGDLKPPEDLLNGPNTFGKASEMLPDLPNVPSAPGSHSDKGSSNVQVSPNSNKRHSLPVNFHEQNERSSPRSQTDVGAYEVKQSGSSAVRMEFRHPYSGQGQPFSSGSQSWNMEFTDATAAAQAAAESAERASMAARAAAELASRGNSTRRYSTESHRDEESQRYADSTLRNEHHAKGPINNSFHGRNSRTHLEQIDGNQQHDVLGINENFRRESLKSTDKSASLKSNVASVDGNPLENSTWQYSTESHGDEESQRYADSTLRNEHHAKSPVNNSFHGRNSRMHFEQIDSNQQLDDAGINENFHRESLKSTDKPSRSASLKSNATSVDVNPLGNNLQMPDGYSQKNSSELKHSDLLGQVSFKNQSSKSEVEFVNKLQGGVDSQNQSVDAYEGVSMSKADMSTPFSQRTRAPPSNSEKSSYSKTTVLSESSVSPGYGKERNSSSRTLYNTESRPERLYQNKSSGAVGSSGQSRLAEEAAYKPNSPSKRSTFEESLKSPAKEQPSNYVSKNEKSDSIQSLKSSGVESPSRERAAKSRLAEQAAYMPNSSSKRSTFEESLKSSAKERPSNSVPKNEKSDSTQSLKSSSVESPSKERAAKSRWAEQAAYKPNAPSKRRSSYEESLKSAAKEQPSNSVPKKEKSDSFQSLKSSTSMESPSRERAAHVHQKLPDYDEIAARLQSIRLNRQ